jgi:carboxylesterase type B
VIFCSAGGRDDQHILLFQSFFSFPRWFAPTVDGSVLPDTPENLLRSGSFNKVPVLIGQNKVSVFFYFGKSSFLGPML